MNKKQKIIISVVGISIVLLTLLGITYAYFLTRIQGNTNDKSISVTTADLKLTYSDGNGDITATNILPGETIDTKTFTITSESNIETSYGVYLEDIVNTFSRKEDIKYSLTCTSNVEDSICNGTNGSFPSENGKLISNNIQPNETQSYTFEVKYLETGTDQSVDMNKEISGKIQIYSLSDVVSLNGTINNAEDGDYVIVNSNNAKRSEIVDNKFKVVGLTAEDHTISLYNKQDQLKGTSSFTIKKGTTSKIDNKTFIITNNTSNLYVTLNANDTSNIILNSIDNSYYGNTNSLTYNIINNSKNNSNGTSFVENTISSPGIPSSNTVFVEKKWSQANGTFVTDNGSKTVMYGTSYSFDPKTGKFEIKNIKTAKLSSIKLTDSRIYFALPILESGNTTKTSNLTNVYFLTKSWNGAMYSEQQIEDEKELSSVNDSYGESYYYRGNVLDNYVNFAGKCWKIVRIEGDGSTKLILEDKNYECNSSSYTGDFVYNSGMYGTFESNGKINFLNQTEDTYMINIFKNFQTKLDSSIKSKYGSSESLSTKLRKYNLCIDTSLYSDRAGTMPLSQNQIVEYINSNTEMFFGTFKRLYGQKTYGNTSLTPSLVCDSSVISTYSDNTDIYIGTITADEAVYAGNEVNVKNANTYLYNTYYKSQTSKYWMTLSPTLYRNNKLATFSFYYTGLFSGVSPANSSSGVLGVRPTIILNKDTEIASGDGTISNPYVIS